jgi:uncharacterized protein (DUF1015 family)
MMETVSGLMQPFVGYIPDSRFGSRVVGPPRATLNAEHKAAASVDPLSFRYVAGRKAGRPSDEALAWIEQSRRHGVLVPIGPAVVVYQQETDDFVATGLIGDLSLEGYQAGRVKRHERTIAKTQHKMAKYMRDTGVYGNPPVTAYRPGPVPEQALAAHTERQPDSAFTTADGITHRLWVVEGSGAEELCQRIGSDLYITDGHHRLAAAALVASERDHLNARMPAGVFSAAEFRLRAFARCISDPSFDPAEAIKKLQEELEIVEVDPDRARPEARYQFGAKIGERHFRLEVPDEKIPNDHYASLNTNLLLELVLRPVFGIENPRTDKRVRFVADLGDGREAYAGSDAWFLPFPLQAADVIEVADAGQTMPAKSTWIAPKLPSGLVIRPIDQT